MKTTMIPNAVLLLIVSVFTSLQLKAAITNAGTVVEAGIYNNKWIPSITLKEVKISGNPDLNEMNDKREIENNISVPLQLNYLYNRNSNSYDFLDVPERMVELPKYSGQTVGVVKYKGEYIPSINLSEINIIGERISSNQPGSPSANSNAESRLFRLSARQTFDVLINYVVEQGLGILRHIFPVTNYK